MRWYAGLTALFMLWVGLAGATPFLPGMKGLVRLEDGLWIDRTAAPADIAMIRNNIAAAEAAITAAFGTRRSDPEWQICTSEICDRNIGLKPRGQTYYDIAIQIGSRAAAADRRFYIHEATHAELHNAAGLVGLANAALPAWLDEGLAVLLSHSPGYPESQAQCDAVARIAPPRDRAGFASLAGPNGENAETAYLVSACAAQAWLAKGNRIDQIDDRLRQGAILR